MSMTHFFDYSSWLFFVIASRKQPATIFESQLPYYIQENVTLKVVKWLLLANSHHVKHAM